MDTNDDRSHEAFQKLQQILSQAIDDAADAVELEYGDEGLEVTYWFGASGMGTVLSDRTLAGRVIGLIVDEAELEDRSKGVIAWTHQGKPYNIAVEERESFGENAYTLRLVKPKRKRA